MNVSLIASEAALSAYDALFNGGTIVFYTGTQPATPETALSGNTAIDTFTFAATAFAAPSASGGYAQAAGTFSNGTQTPSATGTVTFARAYESNGTTVIDDFSVGTSGTDIIVGNTQFETGVPVTFTSITLKEAYV